MSTITQPSDAARQAQPANSPSGIIADSLTLGVAFALVLTGGQWVVGFFRSVLFCGLLPERELGTWSLAFSFLMMLAPLAALSLPGTFGRYSEHFRRRGQFKRFIIRIGGASVAGTALLAFLLIWFESQFALLLFRDSEQTAMVWALAIALCGVGAMNFFASLIESLRQIRLVTWMRLCSGVAFALAGTVLIVFWQASAAAVTIGFAISCLIGVLPAIWYLWRYRQHLEVSEANRREEGSIQGMWSRVAPFAAWLWLVNLATNLYEMADRYMLLHWLPMSPGEAHALIGQYHTARVLPLLLVSLAVMLGGMLLPYMAAACEEKRYRIARQQWGWSFKLVGLAFTLASLACVWLAPILFEWVWQNRFAMGQAVLPMTLCYCVWYSLVLVGENYLWCRDKGGWLVVAYLIGLVLNVLLNLWWIPLYGLIGVVWATSISNLACLVCLLAFNHLHGFRLQRGVLIAAASPLAILLDPLTGAAVILIVIWAGFQYHWIFSRDEIDRLQQFVQPVTHRWTNRIESRDS